MTKPGKKRIARSLLLGLLLFSFIVVFMPNSKTEIKAKSSGREEAVFYLEDKAELFTAEDVSALEDMGQKFISDHPDISLAILTTNDDEGRKEYKYGDPIMVDNNIGVGPDFSLVYILIDMDDRDFYIGTMGQAIDILTDSRLDNILDRMTDAMIDGQYALACKQAIERIDYYVQKGVPQGQHRVEEKPKYTPGKAVIAAFVFVLTFIPTYFGISKSHIKSVHADYDRFAPRPAYDLKKEALATYSIINDQVLNDYTTSTYIPPARTSSNSSSSNSSTVRSSSGGHMSGGKGRHF
jgi:uncharacterized membrane protein YgcG